MRVRDVLAQLEGADPDAEIIIERSCLIVVDRIIDASAPPRPCRAKGGPVDRYRERLRASLEAGVSWNDLRALVLQRDGLVCGICKGAVEEDDVHIDHVVPLIMGGRSVPENLQVAHSKCNNGKGGRLQ